MFLQQNPLQSVKEPFSVSFILLLFPAEFLSNTPHSEHLHSWILPSDLRELTIGKKSGCTNIKTHTVRGSLNPQIEPQEYSKMDSDLTANQYRESSLQSKVQDALFFEAVVTPSGILLLPNTDMPSSCLLCFNHNISEAMAKA